MGSLVLFELRNRELEIQSVVQCRRCEAYMLSKSSLRLLGVGDLDHDAHLLLLAIPFGFVQTLASPYVCTNALPLV